MVAAAARSPALAGFGAGNGLSAAGISGCQYWLGCHGPVDSGAVSGGGDVVAGSEYACLTPGLLRAICHALQVHATGLACQAGWWGRGRLNCRPVRGWSSADWSLGGQNCDRCVIARGWVCGHCADLGVLRGPGFSVGRGVPVVLWQSLWAATRDAGAARPRTPTAQ